MANHSKEDGCFQLILPVRKMERHDEPTSRNIVTTCSYLDKPYAICGLENIVFFWIALFWVYECGVDVTNQRVQGVDRRNTTDIQYCPSKYSTAQYRKRISSFPWHFICALTHFLASNS